MKFESQEAKAKRLRLAGRRSLRARVRKDILRGRLQRLPEAFRGVISFDCPKVLSIDRNFDETVEFFLQLKQLSKHIMKRREYRKTTPVHYSIGLDGLEEISVRCAIIFAAEIDRLRRIAGDELFYQGKVEDDSEPISLLRQLGVFRLIGDHRGSHSITEANCAVHGHRTAIPLMSGLNCDEEKFLGFERSVRKIFSEFQTTDFVHSSMAEAMLNATNHAYISKYSLEYPSCGKRWWAAAVMDADRSELKVIIYDQGHGIAKTLPTSGLVESIELSIGNILGKLTKMLDTPEEIMVKAALESARTRTGDEKRGKGFKDIQAPVNEVSGSKLRITSGQAQVTLADGCDTVSLPLEHHIGGTLIEWVFPIQSFQDNLAEAA